MLKYIYETLSFLEIKSHFTLKICFFEWRIVMFEKINFSIGDLLSGEKKIKIWVQGGTIIKHYKGDYNDPYSEYTEEVPKDEQKKFEKKISALNISEWKSEYGLPHVIDGIQWELEYKETGKDSIFISGNDAYPECWDQFIDAVGVLIPELLIEIMEKK